MLDYLFSEWSLGKVRLKNRLVVSPVTTLFCTEDGMATERYIRYHEERARGGWGLIIAETYVVDPKGKGYRLLPGFWEDAQIESHRALTERVHRYDTKIFAQLYHSGRQTTGEVTGAQPVAPSPIPCPVKKDVPHELTLDEVRDLVEKFGDAALRAKKAGFDGVQIHGGHGYLIDEFMSSYSNKRTDAYGGSFYNRMRFPVEIIQNIRAKCGDDFAVDIKISGDEIAPGGMTIEDSKAAAIFLEQAGVDSITVSVGVYESWYTHSPTGAVAHGWRSDDAAAIRSVVHVPVMTVGRVTDPFVAEALLRSGKADAVAMGRESLADPHMPNKARDGRFNDIRYCTGCLQGCSRNLDAGKPLQCMLNPKTGREEEFAVHPADAAKTVFIAGGGPAGMEAAIVAAQRGHRVTIFEQTDRLGGLLYAASIPPWKGELSAFLAWQIHRLETLGVGIRLNTALTPALIREGKPDVVLAATGSVPAIPPIPGIDLPLVVRAEEVLEERTAVGKRVAVIGGGLIGCETANYLIHHDHLVSIIEMLSDVALEEADGMRIFLLAEFAGKGVEYHLESRVTNIAADGHITINSGGRERIIGPFDSIVLAAGRRSNRELADQLSGASIPVIAIGNAKRPKDGLDAIEDGYQAGLTV